MKTLSNLKGQRTKAEAALAKLKEKETLTEKETQKVPELTEKIQLLTAEISEFTESAPEPSAAKDLKPVRRFKGKVIYG